MKTVPVPVPDVEVAHFPDEWVREHDAVTVETVNGLYRPRIAFGHGPMGVAMIDLEGEVWWLVYWRDTGHLLACWEDLHLAQMFADTLMREPFIDEMMIGLPSPAGPLSGCIRRVKTSVAAVSQLGMSSGNRRLIRPIRSAQNPVFM